MSTMSTATNDSTEHSNSSHSQSMTYPPEVVSQFVTPEIPAKTPLHDANGNFAVGNPGGPGRPPTAAISEAYKLILRRDGAEKYAAVVARDALESTRARDRLAAISEMTDRTEGKAMQSIRHAGIFVITAPGEEMLERAFGAIPPADGDE